MNDTGDFLTRLRERQVIKALLLYVAIGWGFYEIASEVLTRFGFPDATITLLLVFLLLGLPAALFLAWYFDIDRRGIHSEGPIGRADKAIIVAALLLPVVGTMVARPLLDDIGTGDGEQESVAVLPFNNLTGDPFLEYLADGVAEEIIASLTSLHALDVRPLTQSFRYRGTDIDLEDVARELDATWIVTGSVRSAGQQLRFGASVIDVRNGTSTWSGVTDVSKLAVFSGQDELSRDVAAALASAVGIEVPAIAASRAPDPEAYDLYLRGRHIWHRRGTINIDPGVNMLAEATRIDPEFAKGWAALASAYLTWPNYSAAGRGTWQSSEDVALKAIELDPTLPEPYAVIASHAQVRRDWQSAYDFFEESLRLDGNNATAHYWFGEHLAATGRYIESARHMRRAIELDPTYEAPKVDLAFAYLALGAIGEGAAGMMEAWKSGFRSAVSWMGNFIALVISDRLDEARRWAADSQLSDEAKAILARFIDVQAGGADATLVDDIVGSTAIAYQFKIWMLSRLGEHDAAMDYIGDRLDNGYLLDARPLWGPGTTLFTHPDFPALMKRLGLVDYWLANDWGVFCRPENDVIVCDGGGRPDESLEALLSGDR